MEYYVITFSNTHGAISTEKYLKGFFEIVVMPAPRDISRGCGLAVKFRPEDLSAVLEKMAHFSLNKKMYSIFHFEEGCYTLLEY